MEGTQQSFIGPGRLCREIQLHMFTTNSLSFMWLTCDQAVLLRQLSRSPRKKKTPDRRLPFFSFIQYTSCILFDLTLHSHVSPAGQICAFSRRFFPKVKAKSCLDLQSREESLHFHWTLPWCYLTWSQSLKEYIKFYYAIYSITACRWRSFLLWFVVRSTLRGVHFLLRLLVGLRSNPFSNNLDL